MPGPDADAIVEGRVDSTVHTDTITDQFTVALTAPRWSARTRVQEGTDFWTDVAVLDMASAQRAAQSLDERTFVFALQTLMASDPEGAAVAFGALLRERQGPDRPRTLACRAHDGALLALRLAALARVTTNVDSTFADAAEADRQSSVERWARALADVPAPDVQIPDDPIVLPMRRSAFGTPVSPCA